MIFAVAPFAGAWIEMLSKTYDKAADSVAPFAGAWIEMQTIASLAKQMINVAPFAGAWIEI